MATFDPDGRHKQNYNAYGMETFGNVYAGNPENFGITTKQLDTDTGLYYFNARWYNPENGLFLTMDPALNGRDPMTHKDHLKNLKNLTLADIKLQPSFYSLAFQNPLSYIDVSGGCSGPAPPVPLSVLCGQAQSLDPNFGNIGDTNGCACWAGAHQQVGFMNLPGGMSLFDLCVECGKMRMGNNWDDLRGS